MSPRRPHAMPASSPEAGGFFTRRRIIRWVILLTLGVLTFLACWQDPVYASPVATPAPCPTAAPGTVVCAAPAGPAVRMADVEIPATGHASVTALLIGAGAVALLFTAITLATLRRRP
ncbi:hypothetical protein J2S43_004828 [Catenuloplanes nepalensis]|uniref:Gram-positive cocci surface proteins LPxTG domain-containing protein n=1 Tax=Catenuloplanes nepalensis TaxID=587533 RepID=A0ABT9MXZ8_9ACTN|nr:hypothetical protein [Catenuloplanes nepalensis]MDP9796316.1 hypothetical protein [Catenuloplanes nepalensis]